MIINFFKQLKESQEKIKEEERNIEIIDRKVWAILKDVKETWFALKSVKRSLKNIPCLFSQDREIVKKTILLMYDIADSLKVPLDTKEFTKSLGFSEGYYVFVEESFNKRKYSPCCIKDMEAFNSIIKYWENYIKTVNSLEDKYKGANTELLEDLYKETKIIFSELIEEKNEEDKRKLKAEIEKAVIELSERLTT